MEVALINGLFARMAGPLGGRTLILLHAFADSSLAFASLFATPLADRFRLVAPDLAGFGASPPRQNVRTIADHAEAVGALVASLPMHGPVGPLLTLCVSNPVFFWLPARALLDDAFRLAPVHGLLVVVLLRGKAACALAGGTIAATGGLLIQATGFGLAAHALWVAYAGRADDLSEERRAVRLPLVVGVGVYSVVILVAERVLGTGMAPAPVRLFTWGSSSHWRWPSPGVSSHCAPTIF